MILPVQPNQIFILAGFLVPLFGGALISWILIGRSYNPVIAFTPLLSAIPIIIIISIITFAEVDQYQTEMLEIIHTAKCEDLPELAYNEQINDHYRNIIVNEVVLRCLIEPYNTDQIMKMFVKEAVKDE